MNVRARAAVAALVLLLPVAACSMAYRQPEVRLEGIRVGSIGLRGGMLYAQVFVANPNDFDLETSALTYDLQLAHPSNEQEWISFAQGTMAEPIKVSGNRTTMIEIPIAFRYQDLGGAMRTILDTGTFNYRVSGDVQLKEPISRSIPYRKTGVVTMSGNR
jgi:LEA14-like dessication related protein